MNKTVTIIKIIAFFAIIAGIPLLCFFFVPGFSEIFKSHAAMSDFIAKNKDASILVYLGLQILQVVTGVIPAQIVEFTGGYAFGPGLAFLLSMGGTAAGTCIAFLLSKYLGREFVHLLFKEKTVNRFVEMLDSDRGYIITVIVFLIPGIPKDVFTYAAGLSHIRPIPYVATCVCARAPAMFATLLFGFFLRTGNYPGMAIVAAAIAAGLIIAFLKRRKIGVFLAGVHNRIARDATDKDD